MRLEDEIGVRLFRRTTKGVEPTDEGNFLLPRAREIIYVADECENTLAYTKNQTRTLRVWFSYGVIQEFAHPIIRDFKEQHKEIRLTVTEDTDLACDYALDSGEAEVVVAIGPPDKNKFDATLVFSKSDYTVVALVNETHPWAKRDLIQIEDLRDTPLAMMDVNTKTNPQITALCHRQGFEPIVDVLVGDVLTVFYHAQLGDLVGIAPTSLTRRILLPGVVGIPFETQEMAWQAYLLRKKGVALSEAANTFADAVIKNRVIEDWKTPQKIIGRQA
jgi:DNA-binding transcriptional LysR family regulator